MEIQTELRRITKFLDSVERGNEEGYLAETSQGEVGELQRAVNRLVGEVRAARGQKSYQVEMDREMRISRAIQSSLLPSKLPAIQGLELAAYYRPAREVGGDYYDLIEIDPVNTGIAIADVSGKSVSGAMLMTVVRNSLRSQAVQTLSPREVLERTEKLLISNMMPHIFVTVFYAVWNRLSGQLTCASAGHPPLLVHRFEEERCEWIRPAGMAMGLFRYRKRPLFMEEQTVGLNHGDLALFYTDGMTDAANPKGERFGREGMLQALRESGKLGSRHFLELLKERLGQFVGGEDPQDDVTVVALNRMI